MGLFATPQATGLIEEYDITVESAYFAPDATYQEDQLLLQWHGPTDIEEAGEGWNPRRVIFSLGKGWATDDGGKTVYNTRWAGKTFNADAGDKFFQDSSYMGKLIARCIEEFGIEALLDERGDPFTAETWVGLKFHMSRMKVLEARADFEPKAREWPSKFLGVVGDAAASGTTTKASKGKGKSAADKVAEVQARAKAKANGNANGNGSGLRDQVVAVLKDADTFEAGQEAAFSIDGVTDDESLVNELLDPTGLWAEVNA